MNNNRNYFTEVDSNLSFLYERNDSINTEGLQVDTQWLQTQAKSLTKEEFQAVLDSLKGKR